jgi:hypothetical protein
LRQQDDEKEKDPLNEEHMSVAKTPQNSDDGEFKSASSDDRDLKPAASNHGSIRSAKQDDIYGASNIVLPCPGS